MRILHDDAIPAREGGAWELKRDQHIRVVDVDGGAICDFVCFNLHKLKDRFSQARTKANQGKILLSVGDHLYTRDNNVLLTVTEDTYGIHDMEYGMCSAWVYENMGDAYDSLDEGFTIGGPLGYPSFGCYEVLQKALSCVARMQGRFGLAKVLQVLMGSKAQEILDRGLDRLSTYGLLKGHGQTYLRGILEELIRDGCVRVSSGEYPVISITPRGHRVMLRQDPVELSWPAPRRKRAKPKIQTAGPGTSGLSYDEALFERLRSWRTSRARKAQIPPYTVLHDATLKLLAAVRPQRLPELESIKGLGPAKIGRYGEELLEIVARTQSPPPSKTT